MTGDGQFRVVVPEELVPTAKLYLQKQASDRPGELEGSTVSETKYCLWASQLQTLKRHVNRIAEIYVSGREAKEMVILLWFTPRVDFYLAQGRAWPNGCEQPSGKWMMSRSSSQYSDQFGLLLCAKVCHRIVTQREGVPSTCRYEVVPIEHHHDRINEEQFAPGALLNAWLLSDLILDQSGKIINTSNGVRVLPYHQNTELYLHRIMVSLCTLCASLQQLLQEGSDQQISDRLSQFPVPALPQIVDADTSS